MCWRDKLPPVDPNPAPAEGGLQSPTPEERAQARPSTDTGQRRNPWLHDGNLKVKPIILKTDLVLPNVQGQVEGDLLCLEPADYVPVSKGWGFCLLGFMAGKFPGRDAIERFTLTWSWPSRVAFHPNGWMVFRFETEEDKEAARCEGNLAIFGTPLMLCSMPDDFNFDEVPDFKFKVWASLPGLQLELWQPSTLAKIASMVGTPIEVDHRTVARVNIDGPRIHVMVDAKKPPPEFIKIKLPSGKIINQRITFDFFPVYCTHCRRMGHSLAVCRQAGKTYPGPRFPPRGAVNADPKDTGTDADGWQVVQRRNGRGGKGAPSTGSGRGPSRPPQQVGLRGTSRPRMTGKGARQRSISRPPPDHLKGNVEAFKPSVNNSLEENQQGAGNARVWGAIPKGISNNHTYIPSPVPDSVTRRSPIDPMIEEGLYSTQPTPSRPQLLAQSELAKEDKTETSSEVNEYVQMPSSTPTEEDNAGSEGEKTEYESDDQASANQSLASESLQDERIGEDLEEPTIVVGLNKGQMAKISSTKPPEVATGEEAIPDESLTASNDSSWGPEKELAYVNNTRGNKGRKNRAGTATR